MSSIGNINTNFNTLQLILVLANWRWDNVIKIPANSSLFYFTLVTFTACIGGHCWLRAWWFALQDNAVNCDGIKTDNYCCIKYTLFWVQLEYITILFSEREPRKSFRISFAILRIYRVLLCVEVFSPFPGPYHGDAHVQTTRELRSQQVAVRTVRLVPENW